jgi:phage replication O-like protein O
VPASKENGSSAPGEVSGEAKTFAGFYPPRYTPVPDQLFDELLADLSGAELKVLLYIIRRTFGFKKERDRIALSQMVGGIVTRDGRVLDRGTGLHKGTVITALRSLREKGIILSQHNSSPERGNEETTYALKIAESVQGRAADAPTLVGKDDQGPTSRSSRRRSAPPAPTLVGKSDQGEPESATSLAGGSGTQETVSQETEGQETVRSSNRWVRDDVSAEDRATILNYVEDFARELGDRAKLRDSTARATRLYTRSGRDLDTFLEAMYAARNVAKERRREIQGSPMAYFFEVLERSLATSGQRIRPTD